MAAVVKSVNPKSPCAKSIIKPGDVLHKINGHIISDVLDYMYFSNDEELLLELQSPNNKIKLVSITKPENLDLGLEFESFLMDQQRSCANKCIFCFIDQLPKGMRDTLYYKDDDVRLSFLQGNYVTLTNLSFKDIDRIIELRISPINVSVHSLDPKLRAFMMGNRRAAVGVKLLKKLARAGITLNCQIVCCPGINDGEKLSETIEAFINLGKNVNSVSIVPVGLTKHRQGLPKLRSFDKSLALQTIKIVESYGDGCFAKRGSRVFFCADELYMMAGMELPQHEFYEDYPQFENGVGMMRLLITEFEEEMKNFTEPNVSGNNTFSIVTGQAAYNYLAKLIKTATEKYGTITGKVYSVRNEFFGENVTVSGLLTGRDILAQLRGEDLGSRLLIPKNMLRYGENVFLDDMTISELSSALEVEVCAVEQNGAELFKALFATG